MTFRTLATLSLLSAAFTSCDEDLLTINESFDGASIVVAANATQEAGTVTFDPHTVRPDLENRLDAFGVKADQLKNIGVDQVTITVIDPTGTVTLADVRDAEMTFVAPDGTTRTVATYNGTTEAVTTDKFSVPDGDIKDFLLKEQFDAIVKMDVNKAIPEGVTLKFDVSYKFSAGL